MILMIDNFDSFTYNLVQGFESLGEEVAVFRNDAITLGAIEEIAPSGIIISPGPGAPKSAGVCVDVVRRFHEEIPILGVCLGHQCIGEAFGADIVHAGRVMHGKFSPITHDGTGLFEGLPQAFSAVRYHSLAVDRGTLPDELIVTALSDDGEVMGIRHSSSPLFGVQFHPESIATDHGCDIMTNFLSKTRRAA
jgi:anthranilate synthase/aminodeoxychorismate synthase-like glutamine amidotransferase